MSIQAQERVRLYAAASNSGRPTGLASVRGTVWHGRVAGSDAGVFPGSAKLGLPSFFESVPHGRPSVRMGGSAVLAN
jgi:hypothetical protein